MHVEKKTPLEGGNLSKSADVHSKPDNLILIQLDERRKRFVNLQALAALRGHEVRKSEDGERYFISRWGQVREFATLEALHDFVVNRLGVSQ